MISSCDDSPSHVPFLDNAELTTPTDPMKSILKKKEDAADEQSKRNGILKKRNSFESKAQQRVHPVPILKRNSRDDIITSPASHAPGATSFASPPVHSILKKSSSEEARADEPRRPILKKSSFDESHTDKAAHDVKPILKHSRYRGESKSESDVICRPIIKPINRHSEPTTPEAKVITQEEIEADLKRDGHATFVPSTAAAFARVVQPRRKSHPATVEDARLHHPTSLKLNCNLQSPVDAKSLGKPPPAHKLPNCGPKPPPTDPLKSVVERLDGTLKFDDNHGEADDKQELRWSDLDA